ncbi:MAG: VTT domain-containing protein [Candidatus Taylorbacteria bacterium]|nr:VTT domain-containing protein [Candidatus Taylorbacteria bacterium]
MSFLTDLINPEHLIATLGLLGVIAIIFAETGLFFGFFFPGDSLLFTAGFFASQGYLSFPILLVGTFLAAVIGDSVGYAFGRKIGPALFTKENSLFFSKEYILRAKYFYEKHGKKTIIMARFIPIVRTFAPIVAGIGEMDYRTFLAFNVIGGFAWTWLLLWLGYGLGSFIPDPDRYVLPMVGVIIIVSAMPALREIFKESVRK